MRGTVRPPTDNRKGVGHAADTVSSQAQLTGAFVGFDLTLASQVQVTYQSGFSTSMPGQHGTQQLASYVLPPASAVLGPVPESTLKHPPVS
jgi:hypothetical protein